MANQLVFIHGLESNAQGTKGQFFRQFFPQMIIEDYTGDFDTRMSKLSGLLAGRTDLILVGSWFMRKFMDIYSSRLRQIACHSTARKA